MSPVAGALCFFASVLAQGRGLNGPAGLCGGRHPAGRRTFSSAAFASPMASAAQERRKTISSLEMNVSTTAVAPTSIWVACGEEKTHRCPAGKPLSSPQSFLVAHPQGPYTCLRSVGHRSTAMLQFHLDRLCETAEATGLGPAVRAEGRRSLERRTTETIARVMESFWKENGDLGDDCPECMATVLIYASGGLIDDTNEGIAGGSQRKGEGGLEASKPLHILAHAWPLPMPPREGGPPGVQVLVAGRGRSLPRAKHSNWLRDRKPLDDLKARVGAQEVVLSETECSPEGACRRLLLEGLTSNLFVVEEDRTVCTAPSGVLLGGMRQLAISACEREGIALRLEAPDVSRASRWREAFLTGTGRVVATITTVLVPEDGQADDSTKSFSTSISRVNLPVLKIEADAHWGTVTGREVTSPSVAQALRRTLDAELSRTATRLF